MQDKKALFDQAVVQLSNRVRSYFLKVMDNSSDIHEDIVWCNQSLLSNAIRLEIALEDAPLMILDIVKNQEVEKEPFASVIDMVTMNWKKIVPVSDENSLTERFNEIANEWILNRSSRLLSRMDKFSEDYFREYEFEAVPSVLEPDLDVDAVVVQAVVKRLNSNPENKPVTTEYVKSIFTRQIVLSGIRNQDTVDEKMQETYCSLLGYIKSVTINGIDLTRKIIFKTTKTEQFLRQVSRIFPEKKVVTTT